MQCGNAFLPKHALPHCGVAVADVLCLLVETVVVASAAVAQLIALGKNHSKQKPS